MAIVIALLREVGGLFWASQNLIILEKMSDFHVKKKT
jgi:hypothetical protein